MTIIADLSPYDVENLDTEYVSKNKAAHRAIETALRAENTEVNSILVQVQALEADAAASALSAAGSEQGARDDAADLSAIVLNISEDLDLNSVPGTVVLRDARGLIKSDSIEWSLPGVTRTLPMTDGVTCGIFPAVESGVPDAWRFNQAASWYNEARSGHYLGEHTNVTAAAGVAGAAIGMYYYDTTSLTYEELTNVGSPASTTTYRAGSAEFPAEILIVTRGVAGDARIFILDAKDGSMWMSIVSTNASGGAAVSWLRNSRLITSIDFKNGLLVMGQGSGSTTGMNFIKFASGEIGRISDITDHVLVGNTADINTVNDLIVTTQYGTILADNVKAVAIGDASQHYGFDEWGVPRQFIVVGCDTTNGISIIHPNGKVYDITGSANPVLAVSFNEYGELLAAAHNREWLYVFDIPFRDVTTSNYKRRSINVGNVSTSSETFPRIWLENDGTDHIQTRCLGQKNITREGDGKVITVVDEDIYGIGGNIGSDSLGTYVGYDEALAEHSCSPLIDRGCKAAIGMEVGTTDLVGADLVANGGFDTDTEWTKGSGWSIGSGVATCDGSVTTLSQDIGPMEVGRFYWVQYEITAYASGTLRLSNSVGPFQGDNENHTSTGLKIDLVECTTDESLVIHSAAFNGSVDNVEVWPATQDRSQLNSNHAKINGTIIRAAYDGGDVVLHSGANMSAGLNTGAYWELNFDAFAADGVIFDGYIVTDSSLKAIVSNRPLSGGNPVATSGTSGANGSVIWIDVSNRLQVRDDTGGVVNSTQIGSAVSDDLHHFVVILSGTDLYVYIDGELDSVTASVTLTAPTDPITYVHPDGMSLSRLGGLDRKATADSYRWKYKRERRLFDQGAQCTLRGTGNVVDVAIDLQRNTYTILQTDHYTTFDRDGVVIASGVVSDTAVSIDAHGGDITILDGANLTLFVAEKVITEPLVYRSKEKRVFEYDSLIEADPRLFGATYSSLPVSGGDTIGGALLDWDGSEGTTSTQIIDGMLNLFDDEAGDYLLTLAVANRTAGTIAAEISGTSGTPRSADGTYSEILTYDPAASVGREINLTPASSFDGQVSGCRIRKVGAPYWLPKGWNILAVYEDGVKMRPNTSDLVRDGEIVRDVDGRVGWMSTTDVWNTISIEAEPS